LRKKKQREWGGGVVGRIRGQDEQLTEVLPNAKIAGDTKLKRKKNKTREGWQDFTRLIEKLGRASDMSRISA